MKKVLSIICLLVLAVSYIYAENESTQKCKFVTSSVTNETLLKKTYTFKCFKYEDALDDSSKKIPATIVIKENEILVNGVSVLKYSDYICRQCTSGCDAETIKSIPSKTESLEVEIMHSDEDTESFSLGYYVGHECVLFFYGLLDSSFTSYYIYPAETSLFMQCFIDFWENRATYTDRGEDGSVWCDNNIEKIKR